MLAKTEITDSVIYSIETFFSGLVSIGFYIFIANYISLTDMGAYALAIAYASIFAGMANFGLSAGYERTFFEFLDSPEEKGSLIATVQLFAIVSIILFLAIGIYFSSQLTLLLFGNTQYQYLWIFMLVGVNISEFSKFYFIFLKNTRQAKLFASLHAIQVALNFLLAYIFLVLLNKGIEWLGIALIISHTFVFVWSYINQICNLPNIINIRVFKMVASLSFPLTPRVFVGFIGTQFDKIIISQVSTLDSLAVYSIAQRLAMTIYMFMNALSRVWTPKLYEHLFEKGTKTDTQFLLVYMVISFIPALFLIIFSKETLMLYPESYAWGYKILIVLSLYYAVLYMGKINGPQLVFAKKTWLLSGLSLVNVALNILVSYPLVVLYGAIGASVGTLVAALIMGVLYFYLAQQYAYLALDYKRIFLLYVYMIIVACLVIALEYQMLDFFVNATIKLVALMVFSAYCYRAWSLESKSSV